MGLQEREKKRLRREGQETNVQCCAALLHPHVVSLSEYFAILSYQTGTNWDPTLCCAFPGFCNGHQEAWIRIHEDVEDSD
jgi:hypothetical protein